MSKTTEEATRNQKIVRSIAGMALAPAIRSIASVALTFAFADFMNPRGAAPNFIWPMIVGSSIIGACIGWPAALAFGFPAHALMLRRRWTGPWRYAGLGALIGLVMTIVLAIFLAQTGAAVFVIGFMIVLAGAIGGLVFWLIRRPDKDA